MPRYFFILAYPDQEIGDPHGVIAPSDETAIEAAREAGTPRTTAWFLRMVQRTGRAAQLPFPVHPSRRSGGLGGAAECAA